jgi:Leucine-rich repeat (LRR) protein
VALHDLFNSTNGDSWTWHNVTTAGNKWNFSGDPNPCADTWQGITCSTAPTAAGYLHVLNLELNDFSLDGTIPPSMGNLTELQQLILSENYLNGSIPDTLGQCTQLSVADLRSNFLTGRIPNTLKQWTQLTELYLNINQLTGSIPDILGQCIYMTVFDLRSNFLKGSIPDTIGRCTQLAQLYLYNNQLTGSIPDSLGQCTKLIDLYLNSNQLVGSIPDIVGQLTQLTVLDLKSNLLTGSIPDTLGKCTQLQSMYLYDNQLTGSIPDTLGQCTQLRVFDLRTNLLTGTIPETVGQCTQLTELYLYDNQLSGSIPDTMGQCTQLTVLALYDNQLTGSIPDSLRQCTQLNSVQLADNHLTGPLLSAWFSSFNNSVQYLECTNNMLSGTIPTVQGNELSFQLLDLSYNMLTGTLPSNFVGALWHIIALYVNHNLLSGSLPLYWTSTFESMDALYLQSNRLTGSLPASLGHLPHLQSLNLSSNRLTGTIPASFQQLGALQSLLLKDNQLRGDIAQLFNPAGTQTNLSVVQLSGNQLTGTLPAAAFLLPSLSSFAAVDNCLEGPLPEEAICGSTSLSSLVLDGLHSASSCSNHLLSLSSKGFVLGTLPQCLFAMPTLTTLHLSGSGLTGSLPAEANISAVLTDLSLSHNLLTGKIPRSILGRDWANLDLSYNRLTGTLRSARTAPYGNSTKLSLQQNRLSGVIPGSMKQVGSLSVLESNLFSCRVDRSDMPQQDPVSSKYGCGSDAVNNALYAWLGMVSVASCVAVVFKRNLPNSWLHVSHNGHLVGLKYVLKVSFNVCLLGAVSAAYSILVLLPVYTVFNTYHPTFTYQYAWTVSGAFLSGVTAFVLKAVFLSLQLVVLWFVAQSRSFQHEILQLVHTKVSEPTKVSDVQSWLINTGMMVFSLSVVVGINVGFVFATLSLAGRELTLIQILLAVFKLGFNNVVAPALKAQVAMQLEEKGANTLSAINFSELLLVLLNVIVIPCLVVMVISPTCFYDAYTSSDEVNSSYTSKGACTAADIQTDSSGQVISASCSEQGIALEQTSYTPPFTYSYQCSSSFVTYYAPTFVIMCIISGFLVPAQRWLLLWLRRNLSISSRLHILVTAATPRILKELQSPEDLAQSRSVPLIEPLFNGNQLVTSLMTYLALLLTFGALFPPLAVCCAVAMASVVLTARLEVGRYVAAAVVAGRQDCVDEIERVCVDVAPPQQLRVALDMVLTVSCLFYTLFLFDTLGDEVGFAGAFWVLIVVPVVPLLALALRSTSLRWKHAVRKAEANTLAADPERGVELKVSQTQSVKATLTLDTDNANFRNPMHHAT